MVISYSLIKKFFNLFHLTYLSVDRPNIGLYSVLPFVLIALSVYKRLKQRLDRDLKEVLETLDVS